MANSTWSKSCSSLPQIFPKEPVKAVVEPLVVQSMEFKIALNRSSFWWIEQPMVCNILISFFSRAEQRSFASQWVFILIMSTRTVLSDFTLLNSSKIAAAKFSSTTTTIPVAPMLKITLCARYLHSVFISLMKIKWNSLVFTIFLVWQSVLITFAINTNADEIFHNSGHSFWWLVMFTLAFSNLFLIYQK